MQRGRRVGGKIKKDVPQIQLLPSVRLASAHALILNNAQ